MPDLSLYIDVSTRRFVQSETAAESLRMLDLIQASTLQVNVEFLEETGNGLMPFLNLDPTEFDAEFGIGYIDSTGTKQLIAFAAQSAFTTTAISAQTGAQTALTFELNLSTTAAQTLLGSVHSSPVWCELLWNANSAQTALTNKAQVPGLVRSGYLGVGLATP